MATTTLAGEGPRPAPAEADPRPRALPPLFERIKTAWDGPESRPSVLGAIGCLGLLGVLFWSNLRYLVHVWSTDANYSHGFLVPFMSLYFANEAARLGPLADRSGARLGASLLVLAVLGRLATILMPVGIVGDLAFLLGLAGIVTLFAGPAALKRYGFALAFLAFMIPLPVHLYTMVANPLQLLVSQIASALLNAGGIPVLCEGTHMTLPGDVKMFVAEACSGMRQLTGFLALTTAVAYLWPRPGWYRAVLVVSSLPVALTANVARVVLTGIIMHHDPALAQGMFHTLEGLLMMGFGLALLWGECQVLDWALSDREGEAVASSGSAPAPVVVPKVG
ncbi:exosortase [soil metagenome]